jgi:hypothetical protein
MAQIKVEGQISDLIERLDKWLAANRPDYYKARPIGHVDFHHWLQTVVESLERCYLENDEEYGMQPAKEFDAIYQEINPGYPIDNYAG